MKYILCGIKTIDLAHGCYFSEIRYAMIFDCNVAFLLGQFLVINTSPRPYNTIVVCLIP